MPRSSQNLISKLVCSNYRRPKGVMGGSCLNCGRSQPEHARGSRLVCVNGHDRCYLGPDEDCPYCERKQTMTVARGVRNGRTKLSEEQVHEIRESAESHAALASKYGVNPKTVRRIRSGEIWGSLPVREKPVQSTVQEIGNG